VTSQYAEDELLDMARQFSFRSRMDRTRRSGPVQALQDSAETLIHSHMRLFNDREIILASRMAEISPPGMNPPLADLLKNRFYAGSVSYKGEYFHGQHEALISQEVFDLTQDALRKNNGRSCTLASRLTRQYLLKGIVRCAHCMVPMWAQTYASGHSYYREHRNSMRHGPCPAVSGSISCEIADEQVSKLVTAIELGPRWMEKVMAIVAVKDQVEDPKHQRKLVIEKLHRPAQAYVDGHYPKDQYRQAKRRLALELESPGGARSQRRRGSGAASYGSTDAVAGGQPGRASETTDGDVGRRLRRDQGA